MSIRHHMNFLSPYARGYVHGIVLGAVLVVTSFVVGLLLLKLWS